MAWVAGGRGDPPDAALRTELPAGEVAALRWLLAATWGFRAVQAVPGGDPGTRFAFSAPPVSLEKCRDFSDTRS